MPPEEKASSLSFINYITGISDGLVLPIIPCVLILAYYDSNITEAFILFSIVACSGGVVYGLARYLGEKNEIAHNHPEIGNRELEKDKALLKKIGIEENLVTDMMQQVGQEQEQWLNEIKENKMTWDAPDFNRAKTSGIQTGIGFLTGSYLITLPFFIMMLSGDFGIWICLAIQFLIMFVFGWLKGTWIGKHQLRLAMIQVFKGFMVIALLAVLLWASSKTPLENRLFHLQ